MKYLLSLFSGIGGFDLGAHWAGLKFDGHFYSDIDPYANRIMQARFPNAIPLGDVTKIKVEELPHGDWIICGGFPCQDISFAGKGVGLAGARSGLWFEYSRILEGLRPSFAVVENVGALVGRGLDRVLISLAALGYDAEWQDIRASDVGAPHRRERLWIVAYPNAECRDGSGRAWDGRPQSPDSSEAMADAAQHGCGQRRTWRPHSGGSREAESTLCDPYRARLEEWDRSESTRGSHPASVFRDWWAIEPDMGRVAHGVPSRVDRLKCLGNSIVPQIAELIFLQSAFDGWRV